MKKIITIAFALLIVILISKSKVTEEIVIPNESIRIRVIANSNSSSDQKTKQKVRKAVQVQLGDILKDAKNIDDVRAILKNKLPDVEYTVKKTLDTKNNNFNVNYGYNYFPQQTYKGINYDEGYYESVVITLGEAKGENWWCVLFPPLCLMDEDEENIEEVEYKSFIKEIIDKYF